VSTNTLFCFQFILQATNIVDGGLGMRQCVHVQLYNSEHGNASLTWQKYLASAILATCSWMYMYHVTTCTISTIHFNILLGNVKFFVQSNPSLLVCDCDSTGSVPTMTCQSFGGQCMCLPGVRGRQCDECSPGYYSFSATGCSGEWYLCPSHTRIN